MKMRHEVLIITEEDVRAILEMKEVIDAVEGVFRAYEEGEAHMIPRQYFFMDELKGRIGFMPAHMGCNAVTGVKIVSAHKNNPSIYGLPTVQATTVLNDAKTGLPLAMISASYATMMRTGAVAAVAAKYLSREDSGVVGIIGAGVQGVGQLLGLVEVRKVSKVLVFDVVKEKRVDYALNMSRRLNIEVVPSENIEEVARSVDILAVATPSSSPVIFDRWLPDGIHINSVGVSTAGEQEIPTETFKRAKCVVDQFDQTSRIGGINVPVSQGVLDRGGIHAELGELLAGKKAGRTSKDEITVFVTSGLAIQDIAVASLVYDKAKARRAGTFVEWKT